jgi:hypothetical protein
MYEAIGAVKRVLRMLLAMLQAGRMYRIIQVCSKLPCESSNAGMGVLASCAFYLSYRVRRL